MESYFPEAIARKSAESQRMEDDLPSFNFSVKVSLDVKEQ